MTRSQHKPRLLLVCPLPPPVHGSSMVSSQIRGSKIINEEFDVDCVNMSTSRTLMEVGKKSYWLYAVKSMRFLGAFIRMFWLLLTRRYDLTYLAITVHDVGFLKDFPFVALARMFSREYVIHQHNRGMAPYVHKFPYNILLPFAYKSAKVILLSWRLYPDIEEVVKKSNVIVCPNGMQRPEELFSAAVAGKRDKPVEILYLSNLVKSKGVTVLLDALQILNDRGVDFHCSFVGATSATMHEEEFRAEVESRGLQGRAEYLGMKFGADKWAAYNASDIFVLPSMNDCMPLTILEAMMCGVPVVASDMGAIPDLVEDGKTGYIISADDLIVDTKGTCIDWQPTKGQLDLLESRKNDVSNSGIHTLAARLQELISDEALRREMGAAARARYENKFTQEKFEANMLRCLQKAAGIRREEASDMVLALIRSAIGAQPESEKIELAPDMVKPIFTQAMRQSVLGFAMEGMKRNNIEIPQPLADRWSLYVDVIRQKAGQSARQCAEVYNMFAADGMKCVILKGSAIARYYGPMAGLRQFGDIDVWVQDGMTIRQLVEYIRPRCSSYEAKRSHVKAPLFQTNVVECHPTPSILRCPWTNRRLQKWFAANSEPVFDSDLGFPVMPPSFDAVFLLVHIYHHLLFEGVGLRQYMDYCMLLRSQRFSDARKAEAMAALESFGMGRFTHGVMWVLGEVFALEEECMLCTPDAGTGRMILAETVMGGNFGHFDSRHKNLKSPNLLLRGWASIKKRLPLFALGPWEIIFSPVWSVWQAAWRYSHGYMKTMEKPKNNDRTIF